MNNADFWTSVHTIIAEGFTSEGLLKLDSYAEQMAAQREVQQMSLHPCSREQKLAQIARIRQHSATTKEESANLERSKKA